MVFANASYRQHSRSIIPQLRAISWVSYLKANRKEGNVLFNDTLNTFYLRLYGVRHMVKDHSDSEKEKCFI